jgi:hypothetical protein
LVKTAQLDSAIGAISLEPNGEFLQMVEHYNTEKTREDLSASTFNTGFTPGKQVLRP